MATQPQSSTRLELPHGRFLASVRHGIEIPGFFIADIRCEGIHVPLHTHESAHISFIVRGRYHTDAHGFDGTCHGGALIYDPPGTTHRDRFVDGGGRFLTISLSRSCFESVNEAGALAERSFGLPERMAEFIGTRILWEANATDEFSSLVLEGLALELLDHLRSSVGARGGVEPAWMRGASQFLRDYSGGKLTVRRVAEYAGVHPVHLARSFRKHRRCTPGEYLRRVRVERAARQIRSGHSLTDTALACGFGDQSQLTKSFRRVLGHTPGAYRRLTRA